MLAGEMGMTIKAKAPKDVFTDLTRNVAAFKELTWEDLVPSGKTLAWVPEPPHRKIQTSTPLE